jgi:hypothetical protein
MVINTKLFTPFARDDRLPAVATRTDKINVGSAFALTCLWQSKEVRGESKEVFHYSAEDPGKG